MAILVVTEDSSYIRVCFRLPKGVAAGHYLQGSITFARDELGKKATSV